MAELVAVDKWCKIFMSTQGISLETYLYQDNKSTMLMCKKGCKVLSKIIRTMDVWYFAIKDNIEKGYLKALYLGNNKMLGDFFTKPFQGKNFRDFTDLSLGAQYKGRVELRKLQRRTQECEKWEIVISICFSFVEISCGR